VAGYSGTPLPRKLGIRPGDRIAVLSAPNGFVDGFAPTLPDVRLRTDARATSDVVLFFATRRSELGRRFPALAGRLEPSGGLWVAWPKRTSKVATDLTENVVREIGLAAGLVDNKVCAIDDRWSGLRFVYRLADR
jgi:hypothetical protein